MESLYEKDYNKIYNKAFNYPNAKISTYEELKEFLFEMRKEKPKLKRDFIDVGRRNEKERIKHIMNVWMSNKCLTIL